MKNIFYKFLVVFLLFLPINHSFSQSNDITLESLKPPKSPAFTILGVSPSKFLEPETPTEFGVEILNNFSTSVVPQNFSLQTSLYWIFKHPRLTFEEYYYDNNVFKVMGQNMITSIATIKVDTPTSSTKLAFGLKTLILKGKPNSKFEDASVSLDCEQLLRSTVDDIINDLDSGKNNDKSFWIIIIYSSNYK